MSSEKPVGLDDLETYVPGLYLDLTGEFATRRGLDPNKLVTGLGVRRMAVADAHQDPATLAAMATLGLIQRNSVRSQDIGRLYVGTESRVDQSKATAAYVLGMLEKALGDRRLIRCSAVDYSFACIGATYALKDMVNWIRAGEHQGRVGIVIATDVAKYDLGSNAEYTGGAGAVAMLVKEDPRLIAFDRGAVGTATRDECDFYKPLYRDTPVVDGKYSNRCYLETMKAALMEYEQRVVQLGLIHPRPDEAVTDHINYFAFHIPYPRMAEYAATFLFRYEWRRLSRWPTILAEIGMPEPRRERAPSPEAFEAADHEFRKRLAATSQFREVFDRKLARSLEASREVGNIYSGSLYLALQSLCENELRNGSDATSRRIGFGSYGSGCSAKLFSGVIQPGYREVVDQLPLMQRLGHRHAVSVEEYEELHRNARAPHQSVQPPRHEFALQRIGSPGAPDSGYRYYDYVA